MTNQVGMQFIKELNAFFVEDIYLILTEGGGKENQKKAFSILKMRGCICHISIFFEGGLQGEKAS